MRRVTYEHSPCIETSSLQAGDHTIDRFGREDDLRIVRTDALLRFRESLVGRFAMVKATDRSGGGRNRSNRVDSPSPKARAEMAS